jgi:diguanylate cyclase (GGDEF)-like protein/PAS domain S-box-containing protein
MARGEAIVGPKARINLLIPYLDGAYYGTIFTTLHKEAKKRDVILYTIQAVTSVDNPTTFDYPIGTEVTDGWLLMTNPNSVLPASQEFLKALEATGKPVVTIGYREPTIRSHAVVIDNRRAAKEAVLHLIREHGHRRIAYVGSDEHYDFVERFEGYVQALEEAGIPFDESLCYHSKDAMHPGGIEAVNEMLRRGIDFTAVFATTDWIAMAVIETLQENGYRIPEDIAVIGFDDLEASATFNPPITTVRQSFVNLAETSMDLLYRQINGETFPDSVTYLPTELITRSTCGCTYEASKELTANVQRNWVHAETNINKVITGHQRLSNSWAAATRSDHFHFSELFKDSSQWGCLALWDPNEPQRKHVIVKQTFSTKGAPVPPIGMRLPVESFPLPEWIPDVGEMEFVRIQAISNQQQDLGFVVIVSPIDDLVSIAGGDLAQISFTILVAALERDDLFNQIRSIAEQLEIVSRTTNDGIWDWNLQTNKIQWSVRTFDMLNSIEETLTNDPVSFINLIHPEDQTRVLRAFRNHIVEGAPLKIEFRIQGKNGELLWVYAAGDSIRDQHGRSIRVIGSLNNITEKKLAEKKIMHLAYHDILTGLPNRLKFKERFEQSKSRADRRNHKLGVLLIDLDRFKIINDTLGHQAGDELLQLVALKLESIMSAVESGGRGDDVPTVARLGGDEFVVLVPNAQKIEDLQHVANHIIEGLRDPFMIQGHEVFTSASIGISMYPDDGEDLDTLKRCADIAMYNAKDNGRNRHESYSVNSNPLTLERLTLENALRKAMERNEFELYYQPQIDMANGKVFGVEALLRWRSSELGNVSPYEFIPLAEENGLIIPIGQWVLEEACRQNRRWIEQGVPPMIISVNISACQLEKPDFVEMVEKVLKDTGLAPELLCLEITESTAFKNLENSRAKLQRLSELGVRIAIDDFGTGYSSFAMLKHLPIKNIKIDRSFIRDMDHDHDNAAIVKAVIAMTHSLNLTVIAEGVEHEAQRELLLQDGCMLIQGNLYSMPLPADECYRYISRFHHLTAN